jgi:NAD(P)-dependent dehydrogenase (short-subunit alcohol dehydrogenase family)
MLLADKVAVIYGAGGAIGSAIASAFAREGAEVHLAGRTETTLQPVAHKIRAGGGSAAVAVVDALDEAAVNAFVAGVVAQAGRLDISVNVIGVDDVQRALAEISVDEFVQPILKATRGQFLTGRAAAAAMADAGSGVILMFGGGGPQTVPGLGGFKVALDAMESLRRQFACEYGPRGVRLVTLKTGGIPESIPADLEIREQLEQMLTDSTQLGRTATLADVGDVAAFVASDKARSITDTWVNIGCGALPE